MLTRNLGLALISIGVIGILASMSATIIGFGTGLKQLFIALLGFSLAVMGILLRSHISIQKKGLGMIVIGSLGFVLALSADFLGLSNDFKQSLLGILGFAFIFGGLLLLEIHMSRKNIGLGLIVIGSIGIIVSIFMDNLRLGYQFMQGMGAILGIVLALGVLVLSNCIPKKDTGIKILIIGMFGTAIAFSLGFVPIELGATKVLVETLGLILVLEGLNLTKWRKLSS